MSAKPNPHYTSDHPSFMSLQSEITDIKKTVDEIKDAIVGNKFAPRGIMTRISSVETKLEIHDRKFLVWGALISAAGVLLVFFKDLFTTKS